MVEVVGTAPTSVMVITKFVYRHSWKTNTINIKAFEERFNKNHEINKRTIQEIQRSTITKQTKRVTAPELKTFFMKRFQRLDHGFVRVS